MSGSYLEKWVVLSSDTKHRCCIAEHLVIELIERGYAIRFTHSGVIDDVSCHDCDDVHDSILADVLRFSFL